MVYITFMLIVAGIACLCLQHCPVKMLERSIHSARYIFVENLYRSSVLELFTYCTSSAPFASLWLVLLVPCHRQYTVFRDYAAVGTKCDFWAPGAQCSKVYLEGSC